MTLVANNNKFWMKEKIDQICSHPLICHICHLQLGYDFFGKQGEQIMCYHVSQTLIIKKNYYYFEII